VSDVDPAEIERVARLLADARSVLFVTGAGLSADSGLPTYRGIGGLYEGADTDDGLPIEVALSGVMLKRDPAVCWKYIHQIERACRGAKHNVGHAILARVGERIERTWVLTQNVDGLHRAAGSRNVIEIHGDVHSLRCMRCAHARTVPNYDGLAIPPRCPDCGGIVRPDVVLFGEMLPEDAIAALMRESRRGFDLVVSIGTTSVFPYIAEPVIAAARAGIPTVEINPGETEVSPVVRHLLRSRAAPTLAAIWKAWTGEDA
jgi:NAD-dependent deacetylase